MYAGMLGCLEAGMLLSTDSCYLTLNPCITLGPWNPLFWSCVNRLVLLGAFPYTFRASGFLGRVIGLEKNFKPDLFVHFCNIGQAGLIVGGLLCPSLFAEFLFAR